MSRLKTDRSMTAPSNFKGSARGLICLPSNEGFQMNTEYKILIFIKHNEYIPMLSSQAIGRYQPKHDLTDLLLEFQHLNKVNE